MSGTPRQSDLMAVFYRGLGLAVVLLLVVGFTPLSDWLFGAPTAFLVALLLRSGGTAVAQEGTLLHVGDYAVREVTGVWTAGPAFCIGAAFMLALRPQPGKLAIGLVFLFINVLLVNAVALGQLAMTPEITAGSLLDAQGELWEAYLAGANLSYYDELNRAVRFGYPVVMGLVIAANLYYFMSRVLPDRPVGLSRQPEPTTPAEAEPTDG